MFAMTRFSVARKDRDVTRMTGTTMSDAVLDYSVTDIRRGAPGAVTM